MKIKPIKALKVFFGQDEKKAALPPDFETIHENIIAKVRPYTMTSPERLYGLIESVQYVVKNQIPGALVECGVWKGGSMMTIAETLLALGINDRDLYLYDTFEGMTEPTNKDRKIIDNTLAIGEYQKNQKEISASSSLRSLTF